MNDPTETKISDAGSMGSPASGKAGCRDNPPGPETAARRHPGKDALRAATKEVSK